MPAATAATFSGGSYSVGDSGSPLHPPYAREAITSLIQGSNNLAKAEGLASTVFQVHASDLAPRFTTNDCL